MALIRLGIDNGNYNTKSSDRILYASGYTMQDTEFITPDQQLKYNGRYYAIGDRRMSFQQEKAVLSRILDEKLSRFVPQLNAPTSQAPTDPVELPEALRSFADSF